MDWREEQRRANERAQKQHEENRRRQEALTKKNQEDSRRRNEEAKRLQERREDQQNAERRERQRRDDAARDRAALERQTQALARSTSQPAPSRDTYVSTEAREIRREYSADLNKKPKGCIGRIITFAVIAMAIYTAWIVFGRDKLSELTSQKSETKSISQDSSTQQTPEVIERHSKNAVTRVAKKYPPCTETRKDQCTE